MARDDYQFLDDRSGVPASRTPVDRLVRPGLLRAFPLPETRDAGDERFERLLEALAQRPRGGGRAA